MRENKGCVIWLTGLSGAGKTTLAQSLCRHLTALGKNVEHLDGDIVRLLNPTGFGRADRDHHILNIGQKAAHLEKNGVIVVASFISPYQLTRTQVRQLCKNFIEVYVNTPLEECERRDPKNLYSQARSGSIKNFTGISDPYEPPSNPEIYISTEGLSCEESFTRLWEKLVKWVRFSN